MTRKYVIGINSQVFHSSCLLLRKWTRCLAYLSIGTLQEFLTIDSVEHMCVYITGKSRNMRRVNVSQQPKEKHIFRHSLMQPGSEGDKISLTSPTFVQRLLTTPKHVWYIQICCPDAEFACNIIQSHLLMGSYKEPKFRNLHVISFSGSANQLWWVGSEGGGVSAWHHHRPPSKIVDCGCHSLMCVFSLAFLHLYFKKHSKWQTNQKHDPIGNES